MPRMDQQLQNLSGQQINPASVPVPQIIPHPGWGGLDLSDAPEDVNGASATFALDMEVTRNDRLIRSPGIILVEDVSPRSLKYIMQQSSIDYNAELVVIDPPYIGRKTTGAFAFTNVGIGANSVFGWARVNVLGTLLASNGVDYSFTHDTGGTVITDVTAQIIARGFAAAFGRVFAIGYLTGGNYQALGVYWNAASGAIDDWSGLGSGAEFLIGNSPGADKLVAIAPIGFDYLGILGRNSLWVGTKTLQSDRPADFAERFQDVGCVARNTAVSTPYGVTFLSDDGVVNFTPNSADIISGQINPELVPLDYANLSKYSAVYQPQGRRYILVSPSCVWIYEYPIKDVRDGRWFKRSAVVDGAVMFTNQSGALTWEDIVAGWDAQGDSWNALALSQADTPGQLYFTQGSKFGREDPSVFDNLGTTLGPVWRTLYATKIRETDIYDTVGFEIEYASYAASAILLKTTDTDGEFLNEVALSLPGTSGKIKRYSVPSLSSGQGVVVQIEIVSGNPEILHVRQVVQSAGPVSSGL